VPDTADYFFYQKANRSNLSRSSIHGAAHKIARHPIERPTSRNIRAGPEIRWMCGSVCDSRSAADKAY
jgi:hypothetical protein